MDTVKINYTIHTDGTSSSGTIEVPYFLSMEPHLAVALYFFGYKEATNLVDFAEVVNEPLPSADY